MMSVWEIIIYITILGLGLYAWWSIKTKKGKGHMMELIIKMVLGKNDSIQGKYVYHNYRFRPYRESNFTHTTEIDHIVIKPCGVYVIETKGWRGKLTGKDYQKRWVLKTKKGVHYVHSPVLQNHNHVKSLITKLTTYFTETNPNIMYIPPMESLIKSIIVTTAQLDTSSISSTTPIVHPLKLKSQLNRHKRLNLNQIATLKLALDTILRVDNVSATEHINNVKTYLKKEGLS